MSSALRIVSAPWRLARAIRRNGLYPVTNFMVLTLRRRGVFDSLRLAIIDRRSRAVIAEAEFEQDAADAKRRTNPPDLDASYAMKPGAWAEWRSWVGVSATSPDPYDEEFEAVNATYVIRESTASASASEAPIPVEDAHENRPALQNWVVFLKPGDQPMPWLARELARVAQGGVAQVISFDMVRRTDAGDVQPLLFPGPNPTLYRTTDHLFGRIAVRTDLLTSDEPMDCINPRTLVLDWLDREIPLRARGRWRHVGRPLVDAAITDAEISAQQAAARAFNAVPFVASSAPLSDNAATVVICTRDRGHLTRQLVRGLMKCPAHEIAEVIIVANGTSNPYALATLDDLARESRAKILRRDEPFNFSKLCNAGAAASTGDGPLLFLNDDIVPVSEDWFVRLRARLNAAPDTGAVGPLLLYPDESVQHAGMYLGYNGRAGHTLRGARPGDDDYLLYLTAPREVSCLTGAVLLTRREAFAAVGGFDEQLATYLQDVDYGLRLAGSGWTSVFEPAAVLFHIESTSVRALERFAAFHRMREAETDRFIARWGAALVRDRLHPAGFDVQDETLHRLSTADGRRPPSKNAHHKSSIIQAASGSKQVVG